MKPFLKLKSSVQTAEKSLNKRATKISSKSSHRIGDDFAAAIAQFPANLDSYI